MKDQPKTIPRTAPSDAGTDASRHLLKVNGKARVQLADPGRIDKLVAGRMAVDKPSLSDLACHPFVVSQTQQQRRSVLIPQASGAARDVMDFPAIRHAFQRLHHLAAALSAAGFVALPDKGFEDALLLIG